VVTINADKITATDASSIPSGEFTSVGGTPYDLRVGRELGPAMRNLTSNGYDNNFCITLPQGAGEQQLTFISR